MTTPSQKRIARSAATSARKKGTLVPQPCEVCGALPVHAHHDDYSKPLDIRWLCPKHHRETHRGDQRDGKSSNLIIKIGLTDAEGEELVTRADGAERSVAAEIRLAIRAHLAPPATKGSPA